MLGNKKNIFTGEVTSAAIDRRLRESVRARSFKPGTIRPGQIPHPSALQEGIPTYGKSDEGHLVQYVKHDNQVYKQILQPANTSEGGFIRPHYDTGWVAVSANADYEFKHNLGTRMLMTQLYYRYDKNGPEDVILTDHTLSSGMSYGYCIMFDNSKRVTISTAGTYVWAWDNIDTLIVNDGAGNYGTQIPGSGNAGQNKPTSGHYRLLLWHTGINDNRDDES